MRLMFLLTIPSTIGLMMLADPIMSVIYQHGRFDAHQAMQAAGALKFYAVGLAGYAALKVLVNAFYALDRRKTPMIVSFLAVGLNLLFNWLFTFHLGWGTAGWRSRPGASRPATSSCCMPDAPALGRASSRATCCVTVIKIGIAGCALAAVCWASTHWFWRIGPPRRSGARPRALGTVLVAGMAFLGVPPARDRGAPASCCGRPPAPRGAT